ncbi:MAG: suppressor of fused domain protein [Myxococcota bacterium]|nr:suppressor of fused domain protein [Myxococcota bacterium]
MSLSASDLITATRDHLTHFLGTPRDVVTLQIKDPAIPFSTLEIAIFDQGPQHPKILSTCGLCLNQILDGRRMELVLIVDTLDDKSQSALLNLLGTMAVFSVTAIPPLNYGGMLGAQEQLQDLSSMDGVVFFPPFMLVGDFHSFLAPDNSPVQFLWVVPIYEDEASYAEDHGPRELANLFGANQLSLTDLERPTANTSMSPEEVQQFLNPNSVSNVAKPDYVKKPNEISLAQIEAFRESNEVIINVSQKYKPRTKGHAPQASPPSTEPMIADSNSANLNPPKNNQAIRFNLETGEQIASGRPSRPVSPKEKKKEAEKTESKELSPEEVKRQRIEMLKNAAKAAKKRSEEAQE